MTKGHWSESAETQKMREMHATLTTLIAAKEKEIQACKILLDKYSVEEGALDQDNIALRMTLERLEADAAYLDEEIQRLNEEHARAWGLLREHHLYFEQEFENRNRYYSSYVNNDSEESQLLSKLFKERTYKGIVVYPVAVHWQPIQRPQHFLMELAAEGYLCFFCTGNRPEFSLEEIHPNLFLLNREEFLIPALQSLHVLVLNTWLMQNAWIDCLPNKSIWYDVLDRVDFFGGYDKGMLLKHHEVLSQAQLVTYSAKKLQEFTYFRKDAVLLPNAVRPADFQQQGETRREAPEDLQSIVATGKKILGYYGAIEEWFDTDLVAEWAEHDVEIVLIGHCGIATELFADNVHFLGQKPYESLAQYAEYFDALLIPFKVNDLTNSVSPVKFFEYCAIGKPILSTPIREVVSFAGPGVYLFEEDNKPDLMEILSEPAASYHDRLAQIATENTWKQRTKQAEESLLSRIDCAPLFAGKSSGNTIGVFTATFLDYEGSNFYSGGAERYLIDLHELCKELGYNLEIHQYGDFPWYRKFRGIDVYSLGGGKLHMNQPFTVELMENYNRAYTKRAEDNFALNIYSAFFQAYPEVAHPSIGISHGVAWDNDRSQYANGDQFWMTNLRFIEGARNVERLISVDTNTPNWLQTIDYEVAQRTQTIPNYVDHEEFYPVERQSDKIRIVYPRRLYAARGLYLTLNIVDEILSKYENVEFYFIGKGFAEDVANIEAKQKEWPGRVFCYHRDPEDMHQVYKEADIVLIPTLFSEGTSLSCLEACASGNAVIATRVGGLCDLIINDFNGLLISPTQDELLNAILRLIEDEELRARLSQNAIAVSHAFSKKQWKEKWKQAILEHIGAALPEEDRTVRKTVEIQIDGHEDLARHAKQINSYLLQGYDVFVHPEEELDQHQSYYRYQVLKPNTELLFVPDEALDLRQHSQAVV